MIDGPVLSLYSYTLMCAKIHSLLSKSLNPKPYTLYELRPYKLSSLKESFKEPFKDTLTETCEGTL